MNSIVKLRVILDVEENVFRDIEIQRDAPLVHLHAATLDAFGWEGMEMAAFYRSNESWDRGEEIPLMAMPDLEGGSAASMESLTVGNLLPNLTARAVYVYDFLRMWCFYIEPVSEHAPAPGAGYPLLALEFGEAPAPSSRAPEGLDDADILAALGVEADDDTPYRTGDPELDAYFDDDSDGEDDGPEFTNLDDLDDMY